MNRSEIELKVKAIIVDKLDVNEKEVTMESSFGNDLGADSLDTVELLMDCEKEFNVTMPESETSNFQTVGDVVNYLAGKLA